MRIVVNLNMTNSIQPNSSTLVYRIDAGVPELRQVSRENEMLFNALRDSLNTLSEKLIRLDYHIKKKLIEDGNN